ncbi:Opacity-associated protein A [Izhakiella australiensis]|uniref:Opacity-associated protein A n=1 Tax=Izhakiella australiensis TaxID=1926881 RepID=A0A1S8YSI2_9GAMM|nr:LysM-like peptidoglycan-binding domain-containing protein [Izhakiella australiensis]OON41808.1 Opacity-associated protein A [Izhakiella australiensis]
MPRKGLTEMFHRLWLLPADLRWMDPLPLAHRRGIIAGIALILIAFLWPSPASRQQVNAPPASSAQHNNDAALQANMVDNGEQQPPKSDNSAPAQTVPAENNTPPENNAQGSWHDYKVANGQTLAQLFRDNNLQVSDVFAMARVEGDGKPLSNLQRGQTVKVRIDAQGVVTGLTVEGNDGPALFTRQPDGSFIRVK